MSSLRSAVDYAIVRESGRVDGCIGGNSFVVKSGRDSGVVARRVMLDPEGRSAKWCDVTV